MEAFTIVLVNVLTMIAYMGCGFLLVKGKKGVAEHAKTISAFLVYLLSPAMVISAFQQMSFSVEGLIDIGMFFLASLAVQLLFFFALFLVIRKRTKDPAYRILSIGSVLGNVGFFGLPLVTALFPDDPTVACYSSVYVMTMNLLVFTVGVFMITGNKKYISLKSVLCNPTTIAILIAFPLFLLDFKLPSVILDPLVLLGRMTTPLCMFVLGMRLATVKFRSLFLRPFAYIACAMKLVAFPLVAYLCVAFLPFLSETFKACMLILSAAPSGAIILSLAELHECEQELAANVVLLTTLLSVVTVPLLMLIL